MDTKEAIEKIKYWFGFYHDVVEGIHGEGTVEAMKQVEEALRRGEKYEAIVKKLKYELDTPKSILINGEDIRNRIEQLERR